MTVGTSLRALLDKRVEEAELLVSDSRIELPLPGFKRSHPASTGRETTLPEASGGSGSAHEWRI